MSGGMPRLPEQWHAAFLGAPTHVRLAAGEHLYKFTTMPIMRQRLLESPWWIRQHDFDLLQETAMRLRTPLTDVIPRQMTLAVEWQLGMRAIFVVVLGRSIDAWEGTSALVHREHLPTTGGGKQLCVPGLTAHHIAREYSGFAKR